MTHRFMNCIITMVRTSLFAIAIYAFFYTDVSHSTSSGQTSGVGHEETISQNRTHGGSSCPEGQCGSGSLRSEGLKSLPIPSLSLGVDRTLVNLYRSCDAVVPLTDLVIKSDDGKVNLNYESWKRKKSLKTREFPKNPIDEVRIVANGSEVVQAGPYAGHIEHAQCSNPLVNGKPVDSKTTPVVFQNGASLTYKKKQGLNPYNCVRPTSGHCNMGKGSKPAIALDCMEFVAAAMASACLKFTKKDNFKHSKAKFLSGKKYVSNANVEATLKKKDSSCFNSIKMNSVNFLKEGDLIFGSKSPNHAIIITDVHPTDPFGINRLGNRKCEDLTPRDFDFSLSQSTSTDSLGPSKIEADDFFCFRNRKLNISIEMLIAMQQGDTIFLFL